MRRRRAAALMAVALSGILALPGCADLDAAPVAAPAEHPCGPAVDPATARVVDVYVAMLGHLVRQRDHGDAGTEVLYLVDHAVPELQETGIPEREKQTPAPASRSTAEFPAPVRRCLEGPGSTACPGSGWSRTGTTRRSRPSPFPPGASHPEPRRYTGGRLFHLGGVPDRGNRLALAASSSDATFDLSGGLFVLRRDGESWRVVSQERYWVT